MNDISRLKPRATPGHTVAPGAAAPSPSQGPSGHSPAPIEAEDSWDPKVTSNSGPGTVTERALHIDGQQAWQHDAGFPAGFFHTYEAFQVAGPHDAPRQVRLFLPRDYATSNRRYPVVYMNDGNTAFFPEGFAGKSWRVGETLSALVTQGMIQPCIVVAVKPLDRNREYTHRPWLDGGTSGGIEAYTTYLSLHVKGFVDRNYRTLPERSSTTLVGSSHGGLAAFYSGHRRPDVFGQVFALSPSLWVGLDYNRVHNPAAHLDGSPLWEALSSSFSQEAQRPRLWLSYGQKRDGGAHNSNTEWLAEQRVKELETLLRSRFGYSPEELHVHVDPLGGHEEDAWAHQFRVALEMRNTQVGSPQANTAPPLTTVEW